MPIEQISTQIPREKPGKGIADAANWVDAIRHGNIYDVLKTPGINIRDVENFIAKQGREFRGIILQDQPIYEVEGAIELPDLNTHFQVQNPGMSLSQQDQQFLRQEMQAMRRLQPEVSAEGNEGRVRFRAQMVRAEELPPEVPPEEVPVGAEEPGAVPDVGEIAGTALKEWEDFFSELQWKVIDNQMFAQLKTKTEELQKEVQRVMDLVRQGVADPEFVLVAVAKLNMLQNGTFFSWKGRRVYQLNEQMNKTAQELYKMDPNDKGYYRELQMGQSSTRSMSTQMQLEVMDLQKFAQNVASTLEWVSGAIRMFREMRQQPTQAIAAR